MFCLSSASNAADLKQGEDNGFGLKLHAGFYNKDKYGYTDAEIDAMDAMKDLGLDDEEGVETKNIPLLGLSLDNRWYVANPGNFGIGIDARWLDFGLAKQKVSFDGEDQSEETNVHLGMLMPGVVGTFYLGNDMAIDAFYNIGAEVAVSFGKDLVNDTDFDASFGFGLSQFVGAAFRFKVFQVGVEYNIAKLKSMDWGSKDAEDNLDLDGFDYGDIDYGDVVKDQIDDLSFDEKRRRNNLRVFLGFKF